MKKVIKIACLLLGVGTIFLAIKGTGQITDSVDSLKDAIYLEEPVVLPENEGKQVIIAGKVELTKPAHDEQLDIVLETPVAERIHEVDKRAKGATYAWSIRDRKTFYGEASLGEFNIDESMLKLFTKMDNYTAFYEEDLEPYSTEIDGGNFYISDRLHSRFTYTHRDLEENGEMTLVGVQQGNSIVLSDAIVAVNDGILPLDELRQDNKKSGAVGTGIGVVFGLGMIAYGLSDILFKKRKKKQA